MAKKMHFLSFLAYFLLSIYPLLITSDDYLQSFAYGGCSQVKYTPGTPYESNLNSLLTSLVNSATYSSYNKYSIIGSSQQDILYGLYQCRGDISMPDCATCVARAVSQVGNLCPQTCGGAMQLQGCLIKYDNTSFIGVEDKTVAAKKCGPPASVDGDDLGRMDAVLTGLAGAGGLYRVVGAGNVQGVAQCVGDLSMGQCQDCLGDAIKRLKSECVGTVYGDVFLAKCYARFSSSGAHAFAKSNHGSSHSESEKTFAIIIGLLAGVALLIIFLTFMKRVFFGGNHGK
ncbi:hypothetical protein Leryth_019761 [Lithospermum erythrorhizon]|nr:hypothetical protein Leryth_019761 [Lithospermum erythrorhizon]